MIDLDLRRENESLGTLVAALRAKLREADQALEAIASGEVDAVMLGFAGPPILLRAAQAEARRESSARLQLLQQLRAMAEATREFSSSTGDYPRLLSTIARRCSEDLRATAAVSLLSDDGEALAGVAGGPGESAVLRRALELASCSAVAERPALLEILRGCPLVVPPLGGEPSPVPAAYPIDGAHALLAVALRVRGAPLGILLLVRFGKDAVRFDARDVEVVQTMADHAALAIDNARAYAAAREARAAAETATVALRTAEGRLSRLSDSGLIGILVAQHDSGVIEEANDTLLRLLGYSRADVLSGKLSWRAVIPPEWSGADEAAVAELAMSGVGSLREKDSFTRTVAT